jgi:hypothetical protein
MMHFNYRTAEAFKNVKANVAELAEKNEQRQIVKKNATAAHKLPRVKFDPSNIEHVRSYNNFVKTGAWGDIQFFSELPHLNVPTTVSNKFINYHLEQAQEQIKLFERKRNEN